MQIEVKLNVTRADFERYLLHSDPDDGIDTYEDFVSFVKDHCQDITSDIFGGFWNPVFFGTTDISYEVIKK